jgi:hypothetical protein
VELGEEIVAAKFLRVAVGAVQAVVEEMLQTPRVVMAVQERHHQSQAHP